MVPGSLEQPLGRVPAATSAAWSPSLRRTARNPPNQPPWIAPASHPRRDVPPLVHRPHRVDRGRERECDEPWRVDRRQRVERRRGARPAALAGPSHRAQRRPQRAAAAAATLRARSSLPSARRRRRTGAKVLEQSAGHASGRRHAGPPARPPRASRGRALAATLAPRRGEGSVAIAGAALVRRGEVRDARRSPVGDDDVTAGVPAKRGGGMQQLKQRGRQLGVESGPLVAHPARLRIIQTFSRFPRRPRPRPNRRPFPTSGRGPSPRADRSS